MAKITNPADAAKLAHQPNAADASGSNSQAMIDAWLDACRSFGTQAGAGDTSKTAWLLDCAERSARGEITVDVAPQGYESYAEARRVRAASLGKRKRKTAVEGGGTEARYTETRKIIRLGQHAHGLATLTTLLRMLREDEEIEGEVEPMIFKVTTAQLNADHALTEKQIKALLRSAPKKDKRKTEASELGKLAKRYDKIFDEFPKTQESESLKNSRVSLQDHLDALGGPEPVKATRRRRK